MARLKLSDGYSERRTKAKSVLGIVFNPSGGSSLRTFINDDKAKGMTFDVKISVGRDDGYKYHGEKEVHAVSGCLNMVVLQNCHAGGICTDDDLKVHAHGSNGTCVNLKVEYGIAGIIKTHTKYRDDLCDRLGKYLSLIHI